MSKYLVSTREVYRVSNEDMVAEFLEEMKSDPRFELKKYVSERKEKKEKGEVVDEWYRLTVDKAFNIEKDPDSEIEISYEKVGFYNSIAKRKIEEEDTEEENESIEDWRDNYR